MTDVFPVDGGWITSDWGRRTAVWFTPDGKRWTRIADVHARDLVTFAGKQVLVVGDYGPEHGGLLELVRHGDGWRVDVLADLELAVRAHLLEPEGTLLAASDHGVMRVFPDGRRVWLTHETPGGGYPHGIQRTEDGTIYVGGRHAVLSLVSNGDEYDAAWIVREDCPHIDEIPGDRRRRAGCSMVPPAADLCGCPPPECPCDDDVPRRLPVPLSSFVRAPERFIESKIPF
jgi:hypothetical protein